MAVLTFQLPIYIVSGDNLREHWAVKKKRTDNQKKWIWWLFMEKRLKIPLPCSIKLTRLGKRKLDDDNLVSAFKYVRDAIADQIIPGLAPGRADGDKRLIWQYDQRTAKDNGIEIEFIH